MFAYVFGLRESDYCDLLSLLELAQQIKSDSKGEIQQRFEDPYEELAYISKSYGVQDMNKYLEKGGEYFSHEEARKLANKLYEYPKIAEQLTSLLPPSFSEVEKRVKDEANKGAGVGARVGGGAGSVIGATVGFLIGGPPGALIGAAVGAAGAPGGAAVNANLAKDRQIKKERDRLDKPEKLAR
ncbi:MAG: hypothetical protein F6K42_24725, partial [Leptolyngbya sp. SIO1D8]|nr:hypothetical protein [Leptolyngbya sp. SIO1D8]